MDADVYLPGVLEGFLGSRHWMAKRRGEGKDSAQAKAPRALAEKVRLRFSAYLPPGLADWLLGLIEKGYSMTQARL